MAGAGIDLDDLHTLIGRTILVGLTYLDSKGAVERQVQYFGTIESVGSDGWMNVERDGASVVKRPCDAKAMQVAAKGTYRLRSTGEEIVDPEILATWTISPASRH